jgi:phospholipase C
MTEIKHIVYLMLENRSLDNVLGWLYDDPKGPPHPNFIPKTTSSIPYNGLKPDTYWNENNRGTKVYASKINPAEGQYIPDVDPNEDYAHVQKQIADGMGGFLKDYQTTDTKHPNCIMQAYTLESLPVINTLAKEFAVSDAYFSSVPSNTDANRAFALTGNSIGTYDRQQDTAMVDTAVYYSLGIPPYPFSRRCLWDVLWESGLRLTRDWSIFYHQTWPGPNVPTGPGKQCFTQLMIDSLQKYEDKFFRKIDDLYRILNGAPNTQLPTFSYIEPCWNIDYKGTTYQNGNDYHPPGNLACGEAFLHTLVTKLQASQYWPNTLFIITFDEHGGTYDHVEPPTGVKAPWADQTDGTAPPTHYAVPFDFTRLGVRVPLLLISPLIEPGTVMRSGTAVPFDHTSITATILTHLKIDSHKWQLGSRTANAPMFENVITRQNPRPPVELPQAKHCKPATTAMAHNAVHDLPVSIMARALANMARKNNLPDEKLRDLFKEHFADIQTTAQLHEKAEIISDRISSVK